MNDWLKAILIFIGGMVGLVATVAAIGGLFMLVGPGWFMAGFFTLFSVFMVWGIKEGIEADRLKEQDDERN